MTHTSLDILLTSTSYPADELDWRGVFMRHMVTALARRDDLALSVWAPPGPMPASVAHATTERESRDLANLMAAGGVAHLLRQHPVRGVAAATRIIRGLARCYRQSKCDVYHVNWLQCALPLPRDSRPALVTVLGNDLRLMKMPGMRSALRRTFGARPTVLCPNADWMVPVLNEAFGDVARVQAVPFGIDPRWFNVERTLQTPPRWLAVTRLTLGKLGSLFDWAAPYFKDGSRTLDLIGPMQESIQVPSWVKYHGPAGADELRTKWFPQSHGLITLSQHAEGRPQVMLEAMAAGLPIIATPLAAHTDLITHGLTGWIAPDRDALAEGLTALEDGAHNRTVGQAAKSKIEQEMGTWDDCAERYVRQYRRVLEQGKRG